jgi:hypothetical protein
VIRPRFEVGTDDIWFGGREETPGVLRERFEAASGTDYQGFVIPMSSATPFNVLGLTPLQLVSKNPLNPLVVIVTNTERLLERNRNGPFLCLSGRLEPEIIDRRSTVSGRVPSIVRDLGLHLETPGLLRILV